MGFLVHNHDIDPSCTETRQSDGTLLGACMAPAETHAVRFAREMREYVTNQGENANG